jgi:hypothetical protein
MTKVLTNIYFLLAFYFVTAGDYQKSDSPYRFHELTVYAIPSPIEYNWDSPSTLYGTFIKSYILNLVTGRGHHMGHMFVKVTSPLRNEPVYSSMAFASGAEQRQKVLRDKTGLGILGLSLQGRQESAAELEAKIHQFARRNALAAITYRISEAAALRVLEFIERFSTPYESGYKRYEHYGGAFWPLYENEGAGCSAFALAIMELAGIVNEVAEHWRVEFNVPMKLIGGELNPGNRVGIRNINRTNAWHDGNGVVNIDYVPFFIYEPTLIYNWILNKLSHKKLTSSGYVDASTYNLPRLYADFRNIEPDTHAPLIKKRNDDNFFIRHFYSRIGWEDTTTSGLD